MAWGGALLDRDEELSRIGLFLVAAARGQGGVGILEGEIATADHLLHTSGLEQAATTEGFMLLRARARARARARLRLVQGRTGEARTDALEVLQRMRPRGARGLASVARMIAAHAALREGDREAARLLIDEELEEARRLGPASAVGIALRAKGRLEGGDDGVALLRESVATLINSPRTLQLAHSLVELGGALRRQRHPVEARDPLRYGFELARRCSALPLADRAHAELLAAGARPRRRALTGVEALTPTERRVADLAASGMTNPQIAQSLFVTRKTIETHLVATFRKLGITTRLELGAKIGAAPSRA